MQNKRNKFINNVLELSINSGKINENAKYILYSEYSKKDRKEKIRETKDELKKIVENIKNIADSLELPMEEILDITKWG